MAVALKAGVSSRGVLVCRRCPTLEVLDEDCAAVQMQWGKEEGRRAVQI